MRRPTFGVVMSPRSLRGRSVIDRTLRDPPADHQERSDAKGSTSKDAKLSPTTHGFLTRTRGPVGRSPKGTQPGIRIKHPRPKRSAATGGRSVIDRRSLGGAPQARDPQDPQLKVSDSAWVSPAPAELVTRLCRWNVIPEPPRFVGRPAVSEPPPPESRGMAATIAQGWAGSMESRHPPGKTWAAGRRSAPTTSVAAPTDGPEK